MNATPHNIQEAATSLQTAIESLALAAVLADTLKENLILAESDGLDKHTQTWRMFLSVCQEGGRS